MASESNAVRRRGGFFALGFVSFMLVAPIARGYAPEPSDEAAEHAPAQDSPKAALEHYARGREHFHAGRYREAIVELKAALALDPTSANLLYNVAYTSELLGNLEDAIDYYRKYLDALPPGESAERQKTELTLHRLEARLATQPKAPPEAKPQAAPVQPLAPTGVGRADAWFWISLGSGAALLAGGGVSGALALTSQHDVKTFVLGRDGTLSKRNALVDRTNTFALASDVMFASGAALVVTAALLFVLRSPEVEASRTEHALRASLGYDGRAAIITIAGAL